MTDGTFPSARKAPEAKRIRVQRSLLSANDILGISSGAYARAARPVKLRDTHVRSAEK